MILAPPYKVGNPMDQWLHEVLGLGVNQVATEPFEFEPMLVESKEIWGYLTYRVCAPPAILDPTRIEITHEQYAQLKVAVFEERKIAKEAKTDG